MASIMRHDSNTSGLFKNTISMFDAIFKNTISISDAIYESNPIEVLNKNKDFKYFNHGINSVSISLTDNTFLIKGFSKLCIFFHYIF